MADLVSGSQVVDTVMCNTILTVTYCFRMMDGVPAQSKTLVMGFV